MKRPWHALLPRKATAHVIALKLRLAQLGDEVKRLRGELSNSASRTLPEAIVCPYCDLSTHNWSGTPCSDCDQSCCVNCMAECAVCAEPKCRACAWLDFTLAHDRVMCVECSMHEKRERRIAERARAAYDAARTDIVALIPLDLVPILSAFLPLHDLIVCMQVSRVWNVRLCSDSIWRARVEKRFSSSIRPRDFPPLVAYRLLSRISLLIPPSCYAEDTNLYQHQMVQVMEAHNLGSVDMLEDFNSVLELCRYERVISGQGAGTHLAAMGAAVAQHLRWKRMLASFQLRTEVGREMAASLRILYHSRVECQYNEGRVLTKLWFRVRAQQFLTCYSEFFSDDEDIDPILWRVTRVAPGVRTQTVSMSLLPPELSDVDPLEQAVALQGMMDIDDSEMGDVIRVLLMAANKGPYSMGDLTRNVNQARGGRCAQCGGYH